MRSLAWARGGGVNRNFINAEGNFVTPECMAYLKPLIGTLPTYYPRIPAAHHVAQLRARPDSSLHSG